MIECRISDTAIDTAALRRALPSVQDAGGYVCFEGLVRNVNHGKGVIRLAYETYDALAVKEMTRIAEFAAERYHLRLVQCLHRKGILEIGDVAVVIQVLSKHRREAFEGCRYVIDQLKARVPIWKKEYYDDGTSVWTQCHEHHIGQP